MTKQRVLVAMSGGVDSSVTAYLLKEAGYECVGATMLLHDGALPGTCGSGSDADDAAAVAAKLGFAHEVIDLRDTFEQHVVDRFVQTYKQGRTPNPCIDCNRHLKFGALLAYAEEMGCDFIATGHYANRGTLGAPPTQSESGPADQTLLDLIERCDHPEHAFALSCAADTTKDQTYFLYSLTQEHLAKTLFPLGNLLKQKDVRRLAQEQGFENAKKLDSQGICFVPNNDHATYIELRDGKPLPEGDILNTRGDILGKHHGALRYTIGQRKGLGVACAHPVYVTDVDTISNTVTLGEKEDLLVSSVLADDWVWSAPPEIVNELLDSAGEDGLAVSAKIRYRHVGTPAHLQRTNDGNNTYRISFDEPALAIAAGQAIVVYAGPVVLGGGTILRVMRDV